jgi:hypothetical protein
MNPKRVLLVAEVPFLLVLLVEPKSVVFEASSIADETHDNCENHTVHKFDDKSVPSRVAIDVLYRCHKSFPDCCHVNYMCCTEWIAGRLFRSLAMS